MFKVALTSLEYQAFSEALALLLCMPSPACPRQGQYFCWQVDSGSIWRQDHVRDTTKGSLEDQTRQGPVYMG